MPLYSTFSPEALVDTEKELSFLGAIRARQRLGRLTGRILLVRNVARDLVDFAEKRGMDAMILQGDWRERNGGFLAGDERGAAAKASYGVIVVLPRRRIEAVGEDPRAPPSIGDGPRPPDR